MNVEMDPSGYIVDEEMMEEDDYPAK